MRQYAHRRPPRRRLCRWKPRAGARMRRRRRPQATTTPLDAPGGSRARQPVDVPPRAAADFDRAVNFMRAGNATEAELEFKQLARGLPAARRASRQPGAAVPQGGQARRGGSGARNRDGAQWRERSRLERARRDAAHARAISRRRRDAYEHALAADAEFRARASQLRSAARSVPRAIPSARSPSSSATRSLRAKTSP